MPGLYLILLVLCGLYTCTATEINFCGSQSEVTLSKDFSISTLDFDVDGSWGSSDNCQCIIETTGGDVAFLMDYILLHPSGQGSTNTSCGPLITTRQPFLTRHTCSWGEYDDWDEKDMNDLDLDSDDSENEVTLAEQRAHKQWFHMEDIDRVVLQLYNPAKKNVKAKVKFSLKYVLGELKVSCGELSASMRAYLSPCPCNTAVAEARKELAATSDDDLGTRFLVAAICVIIFLLIVAAVFFGHRWYKNRLAGDKDLDESSRGRTVTSVGAENAAFENTPQFQANDFVNVDGKTVPFEPDPELKLDMQMPKNGKGSTDSGLYSIPDRPYMTSSSADTLGPDQMYVGAGSLGPDYMYNLAPGGPPVNYQPPPRQLSPEEIDAMYSKPLKPNNREPPKIKVSHAPDSETPSPQNQSPEHFYDAQPPAPHQHIPAALPHDPNPTEGYEPQYSRPVHVGMRGSREN